MTPKSRGDALPVLPTSSGLLPTLFHVIPVWIMASIRAAEGKEKQHPGPGPKEAVPELPRRQRLLAFFSFSFLLRRNLPGARVHRPRLRGPSL